MDLDGIRRRPVRQRDWRRRFVRSGSRIPGGDLIVADPMIVLRDVIVADDLFVPRDLYAGRSSTKHKTNPAGSSVFSLLRNAGKRRRLIADRAIVQILRRTRVARNAL